MNTALTNLRALAIILIVLGHSIIIYDPAYILMSSTNEVPFLVTLKHDINFIQLKLFFALSGYCFAYTLKGIDFKEFIKKKTLRLLVPYFTFCILWMDPIKYCLNVAGYESLMEMIPQLWGNNSGHLWYLISLFGVMCIAYPFLKIGNKVTYVSFILLSIVLYTFADHFPSFFQLNNIAYYMIFFGGGYWLNVIKIQNLSIQRILSLIIVGLILGWFIGYRFHLLDFRSLFYSFILLIILFKFSPNKTNKVISWISKYSFGIYLFHSPLIYLTGTICPDITPILMVTINFVIFSIIAALLSYAISKSRLKFIVGV